MTVVVVDDIRFGTLLGCIGITEWKRFIVAPLSPIVCTESLSQGALAARTRPYYRTVDQSFSVPIVLWCISTSTMSNFTWYKMLTKSRP